MKHLIATKSIAAVAVLLGAFTAASSAYAGSNVYFTVGVPVAGIHVQLAPVHVQPRHAFTPAPGYFSRSNDGQRSDWNHWQRRNPYSDHDRLGSANNDRSGDSRSRWHQPRSYGPYGDLDRDGIVNRHDRDRDGDGVRNRYDRLPDNPNRR